MLGRCIVGKFDACIARHHARGIIRLITQKRHADERNTMDQTLGQRSDSALCHEHIGMREHRRMGNEPLK